MKLIQLLVWTPTVISFLCHSPYRIRSSLLSVSDEGFGPEESQMNDFIADFLRKEKQNDDEQVVDTDKEEDYWMIGFPMDECHELMLELESVQRAILYHCPVLVHACQTLLTLPLLRIPKSAVTQKQLKKMLDTVKRELTAVEGQDQTALVLDFEGLSIDDDHSQLSASVRSTEILDDLRDRLVEQRPAIDWKIKEPYKIQFMELPQDWLDHLTVEDEDMIWTLPSEQGGNGISPIFWSQWRKDYFGRARMRQLGLYSNGSKVPVYTVDLPEDPEMASQEAKFAAYQEQRLQEQAQKLEAERHSEENEQAIEDVPDSETEDEENLVKDPLFQKTRDRLEQIYRESPMEATNTTVARDNVSTVSIIDETEEEEQKGVNWSTQDGDADDDWTQNRIKNIVEASRQKDIERKKEKPPVLENPVFSKYKNGTLVPKSKSTTKRRRDLPPFPSREHCMGFWKVLVSPTGFPITDDGMDNIILRVDGTVGGGPILNTETRQKASGGTWSLKDDAQVLIRLVIPPKKERILVMEGRMDYLSMKLDLPLASSTFGIPALEAKQQEAIANCEDELEDVLQCSGNVWLEDAVSGANKVEVGEFCFSKLNSDPSQYSITIPKNTRNQD